MIKHKTVGVDLYRAMVSQGLRDYLDREKFLSRDAFAAIANQDIRTLRSHLQGQSGPLGHDLLTYFSILPVGFAQPILELVGLSVEKAEDNPQSPQEVLADFSQGVADLAVALADGRIDHSERPQLIRDLSRAAHAAHSLVLELMDLEAGK